MSNNQSLERFTSQLAESGNLDGLDVVVVEGRSRCERCDTDKVFTLEVDKPTAEEVDRTIHMQNAQVVMPQHVGHEQDVRQTFRVLDGAVL